MEHCFTLAPEENSIPIVFYEKVSDDFVVNKQYFIPRVTKNLSILDFVLDPAERNLLDIPISRLIETVKDNLQLKSGITASKNEQKLNFLALLDQVDRSL